MRRAPISYELFTKDSLVEILKLCDQQIEIQEKHIEALKDDISFYRNNWLKSLEQE